MKKNVYLAQVNYSQVFKGTINYWLPYSIGCLAAYAESQEHIMNEYEIKELFFKREYPSDIIDRLEDPAVFGFSMYVWNSQYQIKIAQLVKERWPECLIVFGGPNSTNDQCNLDYCDVVVRNEGEAAFCEILERLSDGREIPPLVVAERLKDLDILPSPFTEGTFEPIVKANPEVEWLVSIETNRGCPYSCTFCDWGSAVATKVRKFSMKKVTEEIRWLANNDVAYIFPADANFGIFKDRDLYIAKLLREAGDLPQSKFQAINLQYLKNNTETAMIIESILGPTFGRGVTMSRQSQHADTLEAIKRKNISEEKFEKAVAFSEDYDVLTYSELIIPLPLETKDSFREGLTNMLEAKQHSSIEVWPALILPNSEMGSKEYIEKYELKTVIVSDYGKLNGDTIGQNDHLTVNFIDADTAEQTALVVATSTMTTEEVLDSYIYSWMVISMHNRGFSQIVSRYLNSKHGVPYRAYYDRLYEVMKTYPSTRNMMDLINEAQMFYLENGRYPLEDPRFEEILNTASMHFFSTLGRLKCTEIKEELFDIGISVALEFEELPDDIVELQRKMIFDKEHTYPITIESGYNIFTETDEETQYIIGTRATNEAQEWLNRKVGSKNMITTTGATNSQERHGASLLATDRVATAIENAVSVFGEYKLVENQELTKDS